MTGIQQNGHLISWGQKDSDRNPFCNLENRNMGRVPGGFIFPVNGWGRDKKRSFLIDKKGQQIGSKIASVLCPYGNCQLSSSTSSPSYSYYLLRLT